MTATLKEQLHITLLPDAKEISSLPQEQEYDVVVSPNGMIMMRPKKLPKHTLLQHLETLRGLEIEHRRDPVPHRVHL